MLRVLLSFLLGALLAAGVAWAVWPEGESQAPAPGQTSLTFDLGDWIERAPACEYITLGDIVGGPDDPNFHGFEILGRAEIAKGGEHRRALIDALDESVRTRPQSLSACFVPRHAFRLEFYGGELVDLVICFQCNQLRVFNSDIEAPCKATAGMPMPAGRRGATVFDRVASELDLPVAALCGADPNGNHETPR